MNEPWQILTLDPNTATEKDVKAAYARLLKTHRPEVDPEGFQKVRSAYQAALAAVTRDAAGLHATSPAAGQDAVPREAAPVSPASVLPSIPDPEVVSAIECLSQAVLTRSRQQMREALAAFDPLASARRMTHEEQTAHLCRAFAGAPTLLAEMCSVERLMRHAEAGDPSLAHTVLDVWKREGDTKRLEGFAHALLGHARLRASEFGATILVHTAILLGPWEPALAAELSRAAFPNLPVGRRAELTAAADREIMLGQVFSGFPRDHKIFWLGHVQGTGVRTNWRDSWSRELLTFVLRNCGPQWAGYSVLQQTMAPHVWDDMIRVMRMMTA